MMKITTPDTEFASFAPKEATAARSAQTRLVTLVRASRLEEPARNSQKMVLTVQKLKNFFPFVAFPTSRAHCLERSAVSTALRLSMMLLRRKAVKAAQKVVTGQLLARPLRRLSCAKASPRVDTLPPSIKENVRQLAESRKPFHSLPKVCLCSPCRP
jgi:hypothetical protein